MEEEGYSAFDQERLEGFYRGKMKQEDINLMFIEAIQRLESRLDWVWEKIKEKKKKDG